MKIDNKQHHIPFCIISREIIVRQIDIKIDFKNESVILKYDHVCEVEKGVFAYFRSKGDARMAARGNYWKFVK